MSLRRALDQLYLHFFSLIAYLESRPPVHASKFNTPRISSATISRVLLGHVVLSATIHLDTVRMKFTFGT